MTASLATVHALPQGAECTDVVSVDELAYTPTDVEAQCLAALLWAPADIARAVVDVLAAADFFEPAYAQVFEVVAGLVREGRPHGSALVQAEMQRIGKFRPNVNTALLNVTLVDARGYEASHYARAVMAQAYRRGYVAAAATLAQLAAEASEDELFDQLVVLGRERRAAKNRLDAATDALR